ncbi:MAG: HU family DNA-binding protein [Spirochaetaceae bacterium]|nr:HU family DNA-binding protein [Spirochaetaceae bacterium]
MNKSGLADRVADRIGVSRSVAVEAVEAVFEAVGEALARGEEVRMVGFGTFGIRNRPARTGRNPRTGERVEIRASTAPTFRPGKPLRAAVNAAGGT